MIQLAERIRERGGEPREPLWYKHEYLRRLDERIAERIEGLRSGRRARRFARPRRAGAARDLAAAVCRSTWPAAPTSRSSRQEAELLGLTRFFGPHIYGAQDDYKTFSKKMVIERILRENAIAGRAVARLRRRLRRDPEHQGSRRPGRRRRQRRGQQRLGPAWTSGNASGCSASAPTWSSPTSATPPAAVWTLILGR